MDKVEFEQGRAYIASLGDPLAFMAMPIRDIEGEDEYFGFLYLAGAPWLDTPDHFARYLAMREKLPTMQDPETQQFAQSMVDDAGVSASFALLAELRPLPAALADEYPEAYSAWKSVSNEITRDGTRSIGYLMLASSRAAVRALMDLERRRVAQEQSPPKLSEDEQDLRRAQHEAKWANDAVNRFPAGKFILGGLVAGFVLAAAFTPVVGTIAFAAVFLLTHFKNQDRIKRARHANKLRIEVDRRVERGRDVGD